MRSIGRIGDADELFGQDVDWDFRQVRSKTVQLEKIGYGGIRSFSVADAIALRGCALHVGTAHGVIVYIYRGTEVNF